MEDVNKRMSVRAREIVAKEPDVARAARKLLREVNKDESWRMAVLEPLCLDAVQIVVYQIRHEARVNCKKDATDFVAANNIVVDDGFFRKPNRSGRNLEVGRVLAMEETTGLLNTYMIGSKYLGDCTAGEVRDELARDSAKMGGYARNIKFYGKLLSRADTDEQVIRDLWKEQEVAAVYGSLEAEEVA